MDELTHEYRAHGTYGAEVDPKRCRAAVAGDGRWPSFHQCFRAPVVGKWCKIHDPEYIEARHAARAKKYKESLDIDRERRIEGGLAEATVEQLKAELKARNE